MHMKAVIFDLDGVITQTALVHSKAWKKMFDEYLLTHSQRTGSPFIPFTHEKDYLTYIDGKPRYKGVESFLLSRGILLPFGEPGDDPDRETICGLGNRKNRFFHQVVEKDGVDIYPSTVEFVKELILRGIKTAVASSSKNCRAALEAAGISHYFPVRVDGIVSAEMGLAGKPEPDIFLTACRLMGCTPEETVVVEDAVSGVQAAIKGRFGLVIGIAREMNEEELISAGAHRVISDMKEIGGVRGLEKWLEKMKK